MEGAHSRFVFTASSFNKVQNITAKFCIKNHIIIMSESISGVFSIHILGDLFYFTYFDPERSTKTIIKLASNVFYSL